MKKRGGKGKGRRRDEGGAKRSRKRAKKEQIKRNRSGERKIETESKEPT